MRVLVIHTQLWAHYKSVLFQEINREMGQRNSRGSLLVAHIALHEQSRASMMDSDNAVGYDYPYQVLFPRNLDSVTFWERIKALFVVFRSFRPDVLNITGWFDPAQVLLALYAKTKGAKVVISVESSEFDKRRANLKEHIKRLILRQSDAFFCFGKNSVKYLDSLGVPSRKIAVSNAAVVDNQRIFQTYISEKERIPAQNSNGLIFIYVGRLAAEKNLLTLLSAFRKCAAIPENRAWELHLVGEGPMREELEGYASSNQLKGVRFIGGIPWHEVPAYLARADVLVLPSLSEPWGLVVNEAMVCGMPVVVSSNCGCAEDLVRPGQNGFVFDPNSETALAEAMSHYSANPAEIAAHGEFSRKLIADFTPRQAAASMVDCFEKLAG